MASTRQYDPSQIIINVNGSDISGFADGTFVHVERNVDAFSLVVGADGEVTRVKSQNKSGRITLTLQQSSPANDILSALADADELTNGGVVKTLVKDSQGTTIAQASKSWIVKKAATEFGKESGNREWMIETGVLTYTVGGENAL